MERVKVSKIAKQIRGVSYKPEDLHDMLDDNSVTLLRANNIQDGKVDFEDVLYVDKSKVSQVQYLQKGDILVCASSGSKSIVGKAASIDFDGEYTFGAFCKVVRPIPEMADYLGVYFQSQIYRGIISKVAMGANINNIRNEHIDNLEIPAKTSKEISGIVQRVKLLQYIIDHRKLELQKLDELVKARFVEMFGDPHINSKGFPTKKGLELFKISNGKAIASSRRFDNGIPAYGGNGISYHTDDVLCEKDTIVIGRVGFQSGNVHLAKGPVWVTDNAMYISEIYDNDLNLTFLCEMMEHIDFTKYQDAGDLKKVTQQPFMEMGYIIPSRKLQNEYISFVEQTNKLKLSIQNGLNQTETLKKTLMQQYFG